MLVLTRRIEESIAIGDGIAVTVLSAEDGTVRIGITAPAFVRVRRLRAPRLAVHVAAAESRLIAMAEGERAELEARR